jgi:ACS family hexuronate transporter-like MFS transporter
MWLFTSRLIPPMNARVKETHQHSFGLLKDPRLWALIVGNFLAMTVYSLWTNWPPRFLVSVHHLTPAQTAKYTWIIPICGYLGAMVGGGMSWRLILRGMAPVAARKRACMLSAILLLGTMTIPFLPTPALATAGMSLSFFLIAFWSTNHYTLPIDIYGSGRAAFGVSGLILAYGLMQFVISSPVAWITERYGFVPVCFVFSFLPVCSYAIVHWVIKDDTDPAPVEAAQAVRSAA